MAEERKYSFGSVTYDLNSRTHVMGILNVTPDSFSDGGKYFDQAQAVAFALKMIEEGADFIDIGGESTRPGSESISAEEEIRRVVPVIEKLSKLTTVPISIDTKKAEVAEKALQAGAVIVNDISGMMSDKEMVHVVARHNASVVLMHIKGSPKTMQESPHYQNIVVEIMHSLNNCITMARLKKIKQVIVDPGIGFGKTVEHNLEILRRLREFQSLGYPLLIGTSRKSFIGKILGVEPDERLEGTAASVAVAVMNGANIVRVHDVKAMKRVVQVVDAIKKHNVIS